MLIYILVGLLCVQNVTPGKSCFPSTCFCTKKKRKLQDRKI